MVTAKITSVEKSRYVKTGEEFLDVTVDLFEDKKLIETRKFGYPVDTDKKVIMAEVKKVVQTYKSEQKQKVAQAVVDKADEQANKTIDSLTGEEISIK